MTEDKSNFCKPRWVKEEKPPRWTYMKGRTLIGVVSKQHYPMGECWSWYVNCPNNIMHPVPGEVVHGTVMTEQSAKVIVEMLTGEMGLAPKYDLSNTIVDTVMEDLTE